MNGDVMEFVPAHYEEMQRRIALICKLRNGPLPKSIHTVGYRLIRVKTKSFGWAYYDPKLNGIRLHKDYTHLIPHELVHHLQVFNGIDPLTKESEAKARWLQSIYYELWPDEASV